MDGVPVVRKLNALLPSNATFETAGASMESMEIKGAHDVNACPAMWSETWSDHAVEMLV